MPAPHRRRDLPCRELACCASHAMRASQPHGRTPPPGRTPPSPARCGWSIRRGWGPADAQRQFELDCRLARGRVGGCAGGGRRSGGCTSKPLGPEFVLPVMQPGSQRLPLGTQAAWSPNAPTPKSCCPPGGPPPPPCGRGSTGTAAPPAHQPPPGRQAQRGAAQSGSGAAMRLACEGAARAHSSGSTPGNVEREGVCPSTHAQ